MLDRFAVPTLAAGVENLPLLTTIAAAFAAAWVLGVIAQRLKLSPIVGYLLAGVVIGPHTPGFVGDVALAQQLAEIGVILLMFSVGLHFHLGDLLAVRRVAIPGALGQSALATGAGVGIFWAMGWPPVSGLVLGIAMAVASTVVLLRALMDRSMLHTPHGHVAVGWLIVEDILTVVLLVMIPLFGSGAVAAIAPAGGADAAAVVQAVGDAAGSVPATTEAVASGGQGALGVAIAIGKLILMIAVVYVVGSRVFPMLLTWVAKLRSSELFTLTVLVMSVAIAVGASVLSGASVALGAFLAGMVVAQSKVSHQAAADALPMRHAFAVLFFVSVGMLLDPMFLVREPWAVLAGLGVVLIVKPLAAMAIVAIAGHPVRTGLVVAMGLAQIGEFSFIVGQAALKYGLLTDRGIQVLVACAMISITINPLLFRSLDHVERELRGVPWLWSLLSARHERRVRALNAQCQEQTKTLERPLAIIVGYGPVGRVVDAMLRDAKMDTVIVDTNVETVRRLSESGRAALYGDATLGPILEQAGIGRALYLVVTVPGIEGLTGMVLSAREANPNVYVIVRTRYLASGEALTAAGAAHVVFEEGETGVAMARHVLEQRAVDRGTITSVLTAIRRTWKMDAPAATHSTPRVLPETAAEPANGKPPADVPPGTNKGETTV